MSRSSQATLSGYKMRLIRQSASPLDHDLEEGRSVFIGRSDSCGIQINGDGVAEIHCLVDVEDGVVAIQDWASDQGTKVNGKPIDDKTPLQIGDSIAIGSVKVELVGQPAKPSSSPSSDATDQHSEAPREESIGMEHLGYEESVGDATAVADPAPCKSDSSEELSELVSDQEDKADATDSLFAGDAFNETESEEIADESQTPLEQSTAAEFASGFGSESHDEDSPDESASSFFTEDDLDWDPSSFDDDQVDAEIVSLLKSEIEDLRIQLAERDEQLAAMEGLQADDDESTHTIESTADAHAFDGGDLVGRVDDLLAELADHDERVATLQELLQTAEVQNQAEREERSCLETWVGEIEQRIHEKESEWQAEQDALRDRLESANEQRDQLQRKLHAVAQRYGGGGNVDAPPDDTLEQLQKQNSELQEALEESQKQLVGLNRQVERLQNEEPESLQQLRADLAKEKASVSRMRFQLSKQLQEIGDTPQPKDQPDREFALKLQTLREHLREIHEEEKVHREQKGESLFGRISNLWKRVDEEY